MNLKTRLKLSMAVAGEVVDEFSGESCPLFLFEGVEVEGEGGWDSSLFRGRSLHLPGNLISLQKEINLSLERFLGCDDYLFILIFWCFEYSSGNLKPIITLCPNIIRTNTSSFLFI